MELMVEIILCQFLYQLLNKRLSNLLYGLSRERGNPFFLYSSFRFFVVLVADIWEVGFGAIGYVDFTTLLFYFVNGKLVVILDKPVVVVGPGFEGLFHWLVLGCGFDRLNHHSFFQAFDNRDLFFRYYKNKNQAAD